MIDPDCGVDPAWQVNAVNYMCSNMLWFEDPDEITQEWFDTACEGDDKALRYAMRRWEEIRSMSSHDIQRLQIQARAWLRARSRRRWPI